MKIIHDDLFQIEDGIIGIPTNGYITKRGLGVMGAGVALEAKKRWPEAPIGLGKLIQREGHCVGWISTYPVPLLSLPVKPRFIYCKDVQSYISILPNVRHLYKLGDQVPGYHCFADLEIIERTLRQLKYLIDMRYIRDNIYMPLLGCGKGGLIQEDVMPLLEEAELPNSVILVLQPN